MNLAPLNVTTGSTAPPAPPSPAATAFVRGAGGPAAGAAGAPPKSFLDGLLGLNQASSQRRAEQMGAMLTQFVRSALTGSTASSSATKSSSSSGSLAFLKDAKLSVEEKLARLMVYLSDKYEKQLEQKLQQYSNLENGKATTGSSKKSASSGSGSALKEGLTALVSKAGLGKLLSAGSLQKVVAQVAGPVLAGAATALGMPALAPAILKAGPLLGGIASGALTAAAASSSTSKGTSASSSSSGSTETSEKQLMTEIQILQEKQREMFTLVSNILRSQHDTKMAVISNVR